MAFINDFVQCMYDAGATIRPESVVEEEFFKQSVQYIQDWFNSLDELARAGFDAATEEHPASSVLVDANIAPHLGDLMADFDAMTGWPLSTLLQWCEHCMEQAAQAPAGQP
jgi:hypothetical protein